MANSDFEREAQMGETITRPNPRQRNPLLGLLLITTAIAVGGYAYYRLYGQGAPHEVANNERFNTAQQNPNLSFNAPALPPDNKLVIAPPPPPSVVVPPVIAPPEPVLLAPPIDDGEARRKAAEAEAARQKAEQERLARLRSPMIVVDAGEGAAQVTVGGNANGGATDDKDDDPNSRFVNRVGGQDVQVAVATQNQRIDALIPQGTLIRSVLETAMQSDLPGMVRAITSGDTYSFDGRRILLPKGTMLTGEYRSGIARGQTRVLVVWTRALRADGTSVSLGSYGTDDLGRTGLTGDVDNHYLQRFGAAALLSIVGGGASYIAGLNQNGSSDTANQNSVQAQTQAQQTISQTLSDMANNALKDSIGIPPTIHVDQGTQIIVFVRRDLDFSSLYPDPVKEALYELRHQKQITGAAVRGDMGRPVAIPASRSGAY
jgi:type IV secretion system protein VirB10